jgi:hypothetical protein
MNDLKCPHKTILSVRLFQEWVSVKFDFWCPQKTILGVRYLQEYTLNSFLYFHALLITVKEWKDPYLALLVFSI